VLTRGFKAELNNLRGKVTALDSVAWQATLLLEDGRTLRRVKWTNMLFLPPNGARVLTRGLKQEMVRALMISISPFPNSSCSSFIYR